VCGENLVVTDEKRQFEQTFFFLWSLVCGQNLVVTDETREFGLTSLLIL
jgi:hypothetical protein